MGRASRRRCAARQQRAAQRADSPIAGALTSWIAPDCAPEVAQHFRNYVRTFESTPDSIPFRVLTAAGVTLPAADTLGDGELADKLWQVIRALATLNMYLEATDHLSDRELYTVLWSTILQRPIKIAPELIYHVDLLGIGSEADLLLHLKYYADDDERQSWGEHFTDLDLPDQEPLPYDRDRHLPKPACLAHAGCIH